MVFQLIISETHCDMNTRSTGIRRTVGRDVPGLPALPAGLGLADHGNDWCNPVPIVRIGGFV
jgi:hypothetical protein